jgi:hypothetical protein
MAIGKSKQQALRVIPLCFSIQPQVAGGLKGMWMAAATAGV